MPDRRRQVGQRRRASDDDESRIRAALQEAREKVSRESEGRQGVDARARGDDRDAVDAAEVTPDETAVKRVAGGPSKGRVARAKENASERISELTAIQKEKLESANTREALKEVLSSTAAATGADTPKAMESPSDDNIGTRAAQSAELGSPMGGGLRPVGDERNVSEMARTSAAESNELLDFGDGGLTPDGSEADVNESSGVAVGMDLDFDGSLLGAGADDNDADDDDNPLGFDIDGGLL
jgi:hypothetical protein